MMGKMMGKKPRCSTYTPGLIPCCTSLDSELSCSDERKRRWFEAALVVFARLFSNSTPPAPTRALAAYEDTDGAEKKVRLPRSARRDLRCNASQLVRLVDADNEVATVYHLSCPFGIDRRTVSARLKDQGGHLHRLSPTGEMVADMSRLYASGLSAAKVGSMVGISADTVLNYLRLS